VLAHSEHVEGFEMVRALLQHFFVTGLSFGQLTELVECPRPCEQDRNVVTLPIDRRSADGHLFSQAHLMISFCCKRPACRSRSRFAAGWYGGGLSLADARK
jgi:hypothetical protein